MTRVLRGLVLSATIVGVAAGALFLEVVGILVTLPLALAVAIFVGSPAYFVLRKLGWLAWWQLTLAGVLLVLPIAVGSIPQWYFVAVTVGSGAAGGLIFWVLGIWSRKSLQPTPLRDAL